MVRYPGKDDAFEAPAEPWKRAVTVMVASEKSSEAIEIELPTPACRMGQTNKGLGRASSLSSLSPRSSFVRSSTTREGGKTTVPPAWQRSILECRAVVNPHRVPLIFGISTPGRSDCVLRAGSRYLRKIQAPLESRSMKGLAVLRKLL